MPRRIGAIGMLVAACSGSELREPTGPPVDTTGGGGSVQRAVLSLTVDIAVEDTAAARLLGWSGSVPSALVSLIRANSTVRHDATSDANGVASFSGLLPGSYSVSVLRTLTPAERATLNSALNQLDAFGGGAAITVAAPSTSVVVPARAGARGSSVFSEIWKDFPKQPSNSFYGFGHFLELHNNGDSAVALSGLLIAKGVPGGAVHNPPYVDCNDLAPFYNDSLGIWATYIYAFPPAAPVLAPGASIVLATDAIDHTLVAVGTYDLSAAHYEFRGPSDVDNPAVPDMISIGPSDGGDIPGHGLMMYDTHPVIVVADAVPLSGLPRQVKDTGREYVRLPKVAIRDVVSFSFTGGFVSSFPPCDFPAVHPSLDRQENKALLAEDSRSLQRVRLAILPDMRRLLLRTRSSATDFIPAGPTPGVVP